MENKPTETELLNAIKRSGYLLESKVAKYLMELGLTVESNVIYKDLQTGKDREIDLVSQFDFNFDVSSEHDLSNQIKLILEIKNNLFPIVLLSKLPNNPDTPIWNGIKEIFTFPESFGDPKFLNYNFDFFEKGPLIKESNIYCQYCSFQLKKGSKELMALHPTNLYESLFKTIKYADTLEEEFKGKITQNESIFRYFVYLPVLLVSRDLYELEVHDSNEEPKLKKVDYSLLYLNYHFKEESKCSLVYIVTMDGLEKFISEIKEIRENILQEMIDFKKKFI